jgi:hypothetical protein
MVLSHAERMSQPKVDYPKNLVQDYEVRGTEDVVVDGRIVKKSCLVTVHPQDMFKGLNADDFALENVIAVGALDSLKEGYLGANTLSELSDSMEGTIDNVINAVDAAESQNVESQNNE